MKDKTPQKAAQLLPLPANFLLTDFNEKKGPVLF
jgi:hypothetical protein